MREAAVLIFAYFLGAIPIGLMVGKVARGIVIRDFGSGNIGTTNIMRTLGPKAATVVFLGDTVKGLIPVLLARTLLTGPHAPYWVIAAGLVSVVGHSASVFLGFRGGKGVATSLGVIIGMNWLIATITFVLWVTLVVVTRYVSIASLIAPFSVPIMMMFSGRLFGEQVPHPYTVFALIAAHLIFLKHVPNIKRLINGTEPKFGQKVKLEGD
jgi:glycerol-3-phosphate acyltransferase PlsY